MNGNIRMKFWDVVTHLYLHFNGGLVKYNHDKIMIPSRLQMCVDITYSRPCNNQKPPHVVNFDLPPHQIYLSKPPRLVPTIYCCIKTDHLRPASQRYISVVYACYQITYVASISLTISITTDHILFSLTVFRLNDLSHCFKNWPIYNLQ